MYYVHCSDESSREGTKKNFGSIIMVLDIENYFINFRFIETRLYILVSDTNIYII